jgi:hypothetical protein
MVMLRSAGFFRRRLFAHSWSDCGWCADRHKTLNNAINSGSETVVCSSSCVSPLSHHHPYSSMGADVICTETSPTHLSRKFSINTIPSLCGRVGCRCTSAKQPSDQGPQSHAEKAPTRGLPTRCNKSLESHILILILPYFTKSNQRSTL